MYLLADIGGTNTRLMLAHPDGLCHGSLQTFRNTNFDSLAEVLRSYLPNLAPQSLRAACFAFAGPVTDSAPRLTNLDWLIDPADLAHILGSRPILLNDLAALGLALPHIPPDEASLLCPAASHPHNDQHLVVGIGTGMNVCAVHAPSDRARGLTIWQSEYGHAPLPLAVAQGLPYPAPATTEGLFGGRGLARFLEAGGSDADYAALIGTLCGTLAAQFLPTAGIAIAGGVARAVLTANPKAFVTAYTASCTPQSGRPAVSLVTSDSAALLGCWAHLCATSS